MRNSKERRRFLTIALVGAGSALGGSKVVEAATKHKEPDVTPSEDLMREHGVLRRVLLIYEEAARRLSGGSRLPVADVLGTTAGIVRKFVEDYHEHVEETQVFPRLQKAGQQTELVRILLAQHQAGRKLTATILDNGNAAAQGTAAPRTAVLEAIAAFIRMYRPHASREDTQLFPAFQKLFTPSEFDRLGERFEEEEHKMLGSAGFEGTLKEVEQLEKDLGIYDLAHFTPQ